MVQWWIFFCVSNVFGSHHLQKVWNIEHLHSSIRIVHKFIYDLHLYPKLPPKPTHKEIPKHTKCWWNVYLPGGPLCSWDLFHFFASLSLKAKVERPVTPSPIPTPKANKSSPSKARKGALYLAPVAVAVDPHDSHLGRQYTSAHRESAAFPRFQHGHITWEDPETIFWKREEVKTRMWSQEKQKTRIWFNYTACQIWMVVFKTHDFSHDDQIFEFLLGRFWPKRSTQSFHWLLDGGFKYTVVKVDGAAQLSSSGANSKESW